MKTLTALILVFLAPLSLLAQSSAEGKMASGLSIALIIFVGIVIYMGIKLQKLQRENLSLRSQLKQQNEH